MSFVVTAPFQTIYNPFTQKLDYYHTSNFSGENITVDNINAINITAELISGNLSWSNLTDYPVACPANSAITQLGDSVICTTFGDAFYEFGSSSFNGSGNFTTTGNVTANKLCLDSDCNHSISKNSGGFPFNGVAEDATWFNDKGEESAGEITYLFSNQNNTNLWMQTGRNNSFGGFGNSFGLVPTYMANENFTEGGIINLSKASDYLFLCTYFNQSCDYSADTKGNVIDQLPGGPLLWTMGDLEVWQSATIWRGLSVHENLDVILNEGEDMDIIGGAIHPRKSRIELIGFAVGDQVTRLFSSFEDGVLFPMVLLTSGKGADEWAVRISVLCPMNGNFCSHAGAAGGTQDTIMRTNISTQDLDNLNFSFKLSTLDMSFGGDLEVTIDDNEGNSATLYSLIGSDISDSLISTGVSSTYDDKSIITIGFIFSSSHPSRGEVFVDSINMTGNATTSTEANVTRFDTEIKLGEGLSRGDGSGRSIFDIYWNDSSKVLELPGNTTFIDTISTTLNVTQNASIGDTLFVDFIQSLDNNKVQFDDDVMIYAENLMFEDAGGGSTFDGQGDDLAWSGGIFHINDFSFIGNVITEGSNTISFADNQLITQGDFSLDSDNAELFLGAVQDVSLRYQGTHLLINQELGDGATWVNRGTFSPVDFSTRTNYGLIVTRQNTELANSVGIWTAALWDGSDDVPFTTLLTGLNAFSYTANPIGPDAGDLTRTNFPGSMQGGFYEARHLSGGTVAMGVGVALRGQVNGDGTMIEHRALWITNPSVGGGGSMGTANGIWIDYISAASTNRGIVLDGDGMGADILFGDNQETRIYQSGIVFHINNSVGNVQIGDGSLQKNITLTSPDGTEYNCGVNDGGAFSCI